MNIAHSMIKTKTTATAASLFGKRNADPDNFVRKRTEPYAGSATNSNPDGGNLKKPTDGLETMRLNIMNEVKGMMSKMEHKPLSYNHYCWSHGTGNHDSKSCKHIKPGHVETATSKNNKEAASTCIKREITNENLVLFLNLVI